MTTWDPGFTRAADDAQLNALIDRIRTLADHLNRVATSPAPATPPNRPSPEPAPPDTHTGVCMGAWPSDLPH